MARVLDERVGERVATVGDYGRWLLRARGCTACHGSGPIGPELAAVAGSRRALADGRAIEVRGDDGRAYLREAITRPEAFITPGSDSRVAMPAYALPDAELTLLVEVILAGDVEPP
jgi:mono/diheme cytochrome c family protein